MHWSALDQLWATGRAVAWTHAYQSLWMNHPLPCSPSSPKSAASRAPQEMLKHSSISVSVGSLGPGVYKVWLTLLASLAGMGFDSKHQFGCGQGSEEPKAFHGQICIFIQICIHPESLLVLIVTEVKVKVLVAQLCLTLRDPMDCSPPGSFVHGILSQE